MCIRDRLMWSSYFIDKKESLQHRRALWVKASGLSTYQVCICPYVSWNTRQEMFGRDIWYDTCLTRAWSPFSQSKLAHTAAQSDVWYCTPHQQRLRIILLILLYSTTGPVWRVPINRAIKQLHDYELYECFVSRVILFSILTTLRRMFLLSACSSSRFRLGFNLAGTHQQQHIPPSSAAVNVAADQ